MDGKKKDGHYRKHRKKEYEFIKRDNKNIQV